MVGSNQLIEDYQNPNKRQMKDIIEVIVELSRMHGQAIDRAQAEALNNAVKDGYEKWQESKRKEIG